MLEINDLRVSVEGKQILKGLNLSVPAGEVHAVMGPNGAGKSTLAYALAGREGYEHEGGSAKLLGKSIIGLDPEDRAALGLFLAFQYPVEIPGVAGMTFLKTALNAMRVARGQEELSALDFLKLVRERLKSLGIDEAMLKRPVNVGFSGGEKKRFEILQMALLDPKIAVLDETDSGLDVDALRIVGKGVTNLKSKDRGMLVITHYQRLLDHIIPDFVHIMVKGKIIESGGPDLAKLVEKEGYKSFLNGN